MTTNCYSPSLPPRSTSSPNISSTHSAHSPKRTAPSKQPSSSFWGNRRHQQIQTATQLADSVRIFLAVLSPVFFAREYLSFEPEPNQERALQNFVYHKRLALNCNRQWGKSTVIAIMAAHRLFTQDGTTVLIVAPSGRQSGETFLKVAKFLRLLNIRPERDGVNALSMVLPNESRIVSLPGVDDTARGFSAISLLIFDEASRVRDEIYLALRPSLAVSRGDIILISTPNGKRGFFYREMTQSKVAWFRHTGPVSDCGPRIPADFLEEEKERGDSFFRQEYLCEFVESRYFVLDDETIHKMIKRELEAFKWL